MSSDEKLCLKRVLLQGNEQQPVSACKVKVIVSELRSVRLAAQDPPHFIDCNLRGGDFRAARPAAAHPRHLTRQRDRRTQPWAGVTMPWVDVLASAATLKELVEGDSISLDELRHELAERRASR